MWLVQKEFSVAERRFGVLINSHDDGLDVVVAPTLRGVLFGRYRACTGHIADYLFR